MVYDQTGARVSRYDKLHLFDVDLENGESYRESDYIESGNQIVVTDTPVGRLGLSVCYDLRFPEVYRQLSQEGARILSIPSAFTAITGRAHWEILLRSRAIENQAYVIAPAQWGEHASGRRTYGDSMIVGPWGDILARRFSGIGVVFAEVDDNRLDGIRHHFPSLDHRHL
jgi:nitrilase